MTPSRLKRFWIFISISLMAYTVFCNQMKIFEKIDPRLPNDFEDCFLRSFSIKNSKFCGSACSRHPDCNIFCLTSGNECRLYRALVSHYWNGTDDSPIILGDCFTSWRYTNDVAPFAVITATPSFMGDESGRGKYNAVNGYVCDKERPYIYTSEQTDNAWWVADLGSVKKVTDVLVLSRPSSLYGSKFKNIEVRVGNTYSSNGDFSANALLGVYPDEAPYKTTITITAKTPISGRFVSIQTLTTNYYLVMADVKILVL